MGHLLENLTQFARSLRSLGLAVPGGSTVEAARAVQQIDIGNREDFRFALRAVLVRRAEDLQVFDQAFRLFWGRPSGTKTKLDLRPLGSERRFGDPIVEMESLSGTAVRDEGDGETRLERVQIATYSDREVLRQKDFKNLTSEEMAQAVRLLRDLRWQPAPRRTKRWVPGPGSSPDPRKLLARFARREADPTTPPTRVRKTVSRRLVLLCDISGSMERYTRMLLWFACCLTGNLHRVESFLFATRLTRITKKLRGRRGGNPLREIARLVPDWSGGTRIGESVRAFNVQWARRALGRGAVVLLVSDGWDRGDPEALRTEMSRLRRSCQRLIWLSPLLGSPAYKPLTRGLRAALPFVDDFLPVHNLASLDRLAAHLNSLPGAARRQAGGRGATSSEGIW
jgi:uncharacterized protein with von Willebrand factor type A (vWA) domain